MVSFFILTGGGLMLTIEGNNIYLTRGDTAYIEVPIERFIDGEMVPYEMEEADKLIFTVKTKYTDANYLIQKTLIGENTFHIEPADTKTMDYGKYEYDIELDTANGDVFTVVTKSLFKLEPEVT